MAVDGECGIVIDIFAIFVVEVFEILFTVDNFAGSVLMFTVGDFAEIDQNNFEHTCICTI